MLHTSTPEEDRAVRAHFAHLQRLTSEGTVLLAGRTLNADATSFGIVLLEASSDDAAERLMQKYPAVQAGVFEAKVFPYCIALISPRILPSD